jgi:hypothetical protein
VTRGAVGWALFVLVAHTLTRLAYWIAGPGEIERRIAAGAWLEARPVDYDRRETW